MSKYKNRKVTVDGETFDSMREYNRWCELKLLERAGEITGLERQVKFELLPKQEANGKTVEREVTYVADFTYMENGEQIVEDVKASANYQTDVYRIKRKLMLFIHGIRIRETY